MSFLTNIINKLLVNPVLAAGVGGTGNTNTLTNPLAASSFTDLAQKITGYLITIGVPIFVIMVLYGGYLIMTAGGNPDRVKSGKNTILWAVIGYAIIICAWGIIAILKQILGTGGTGEISGTNGGAGSGNVPTYYGGSQGGAEGPGYSGSIQPFK